MEDSPYSELKSSLSSIPAKALNFSSRKKLANNLDCPQPLQSDNGLCKDYRGLAELMGFQYSAIRIFEESKDRTMQILESWATRPNATLDKLISYLEEIDRYDVIEELIPLLKKNVADYLEYQQSESPIQVAEVTPGPMNLQHSEKGFITRDDSRSGKHTTYDAYVSYADEDSNIAAEFARILEAPTVGLKLFIRGRDMLAGCTELDTDIELIKNRCRRMLILLTPNFLRSPQSEFQVSFAGSLAIEQKQRILIPVILAPCEIPPILNSVSKIDFTKEYTQDWMWDKLVTSLLPEDKIFLASLGRCPLRSRNVMINSTPSVSVEARPVITFPQSARHSLCSADNSGAALSIMSVDSSDNNNNNSGACSEMKDSAVCSEPASPPSKTSPSSKRFQLLSFLRRKGPSSSALSTSFSSGATSGFHSQSSSNVKSPESPSDRYSDDTSL